jgi:hypothetical protein
MKRFHVSNLQEKVSCGLSLTGSILVFNLFATLPFSFFFDPFRDPQVTARRIIYSILE